MCSRIDVVTSFNLSTDTTGLNKSGPAKKKNIYIRIRDRITDPRFPRVICFQNQINSDIIPRMGSCTPGCLLKTDLLPHLSGRDGGTHGKMIKKNNITDEPKQAQHQRQNTPGPLAFMLSPNIFQNKRLLMHHVEN